MIFDKYTRSAYASRLVIVLIDTVIAVVALFLASILRYNFDLTQTFATVFDYAWIILLVRIICFRWFKTYAVIVRYAGASDITQVFLSITAGTILLFGLSIVLKPQGILIPKSILVIEYFLMLTMMGASRLLMPTVFFFLFSNREQRDNVIIIGGGQLGAITRNIVRQDVNARYNAVAIIDDNRDIHNKFLDGIPVFHTSELERIVIEEGVSTAIFAIKNVSNRRKTELVDSCLNLNLKVLEVPYQNTWSENTVQAHQLREIRIEDLLSRSPIMLEKEKAQRELGGRVVMITGGAGSIGSELVRQIIQFEPSQLYVVDQAETPLVNLGLEIQEEYDFDRVRVIVGDVSDQDRMEVIFKQCQPEIVFHAAAYKHVPIMESFPREAVKVNILGTKILADLACAYEVSRFVMVSTDKAVNPTNVMGATKRIAEMYVQSLNELCETQYITTRFGNVLGSNGSVVPRFQKQIQNGGPVTVTHEDITRYFMTIPEASQLVLEAGAMGNGGELFLFDMGEPVKISDLAKRIIKLSGLQPGEDIEIQYTGLRPGEKLYEELLTTNENSIPTHHPKIMCAKTEYFSRDFVVAKIQQLQDTLDDTDDMDLVSIMKEIVPEYISNNSRFDKIDARITSNTP